MRKKILTLAASLLLATTAVNAQQFDDAPKSEFSVSYGYLPLYSLGEALGEAFGNVFGNALLFGAEGEVTNKTNYGVLNLDYNYHLSPKIAIGLNASFSLSHGDIKVSHVEKNASGSGSSLVVGQKIGDTNGMYYAVMPTIKFDWFRREHISMYSRVSAGVLFAHTTEKVNDTDSSSERNESTNRTVFEFQVSPFGIEGGSNHCRAFAEFGFGQCGIAQIGFRTRF